MSKASVFAMLSVVSAELYCPTQQDFTAVPDPKHPGSVEWLNNGNGWKITGTYRVQGQTSFDMLGGYVEMDIDTSAAHTGINNNFYLVFPDSSQFPRYCDIQLANWHPSCMEMDIIENNGNCIGQTTWHTWPNKNGGCDRNGCPGKSYRKGRTNVKTTFNTGGFMQVYFDGRLQGLTRQPGHSAISYAVGKMRSVGGQIMSSQWQGWVPYGNCGGNGDLGSSVFSIENVKVSGKVVQGREPTRCGGPSPTPPSPTPPSPTPPSPTPSGEGKCCFWHGCGGSCKANGYCAQSQTNCETNCKGKWCPSVDNGNTTLVV